MTTTPGPDGLAYAEGWDDASYAAIGEIDELEARRRHDAGERYAALVGGRTRPDTALELTLANGLVRVFFLRPDGRATCSYAFMRPEGEDRLWLQGVLLESWEGDRRTGTEWTVLKPDGQLHAERTAEGAPMAEVVDDTLSPEQLAQVDLWEPVPAFGDYRSIARFERVR